METTFVTTNIWTQLQGVVAGLRSQALKPDSQNAAGSHRLTRELSELGSSTSGRDSQTGEAAAVMEDPTSVVALLSVAGMQLTVLVQVTVQCMFCIVICCTVC